MRNKKNLIILGIILAVSGSFFFLKRFVPKESVSHGQPISFTQTKDGEEKIQAEKLEIFYFHSSARCFSCLRLEELIQKTVQEEFSRELDQGKVIFRQINIGLAENKELAKKFQASGSSLFFNAISEDKENISQDVQVWRLLSDETKFKNYLKNKINKILEI